MPSLIRKQNIHIPIRNSAEKGSHQNRIKSIVDRLTAANTSRPNATEIRRDPTLRHTRYDDAKECTFKPQINGQKVHTKYTAIICIQIQTVVSDFFIYIIRIRVCVKTCLFLFINV